MELSVVLCDDPHITQLNAEWRGKAAPTDVLSFEMAEEEAEDLEAEVGGTVVCILRVKRESNSRKLVVEVAGRAEEAEGLEAEVSLTFPSFLLPQAWPWPGPGACLTSI